METAISLSDTLFEKAEQTAHYMGIPRSKLFAIAVEDYINRYNGEMITKKLNEVYMKKLIPVNLHGIWMSVLNH